MAARVRALVIIWFVLVHTVAPEVNIAGDIRISKPQSYDCSSVRPSMRLISRQFYSVLPFFDVNEVNSVFLKNFQALLQSLSESGEYLDREAAFYAVILTPLIFLNKYKDSWCLLEKFHKSLQKYKGLTLEQRQRFLKLLQKTRVLSQKVRDYIFDLPVSHDDYRAKSDYEELEYEPPLFSQRRKTTRKISLVSVEPNSMSALDERKKVDFDRRNWSPTVMQTTHASTLESNDYIVKDFLRDVLNQQQTGITPEEKKEKQENVKYMKLLLKSLG